MVVADDMTTLGQPEGNIGCARVRLVGQMTSCASYKLPEVKLRPGSAGYVRHLEGHS